MVYKFPKRGAKDNEPTPPKLYYVLINVLGYKDVCLGPEKFDALKELWPDHSYCNPPWSRKDEFVDAGSTPPDSTGIWLFNGVPSTDNINDWTFYWYDSISSPKLITGLSYSSPNAYIDFSTPSSPGDIVYNLVYFTQSITNTLSSPVSVYTIVLVGAVYGSRSTSPVYLPITFYVFSPPIVLSPGVTMTVTVTLGYPYGIVVGPAQ